MATPSLGAPMWLERQAVPKSKLIDPVFKAVDETSTDRVDHSAWDNFLKAYVIPGEDGATRVDYGGVSDEDREVVSDYVVELSTIDIAALNPDEQLAFWINLYNAATVELILRHYPLKTIQDIKSPWDQPVVSIEGVTLTLNNIEHGVIRPIFKEPRIHYAVNCAAIGCPDLGARAFTGAALEEMLDEAARSYVNHPRGVTLSRGKVTASKIYGWYREDFGADEAEVLDHIRQYATPALKKALKDQDDIVKYAYDWALNEAE